LVNIVVTNENLHAGFLFDRAIDGPMAKALGPLAHGYAQFECGWHPRYEPIDILTLRLPMGTAAANSKKFGRLPFLGSSSDKSVLASIFPNGRSGDKEQ
jgi:hypothetical protein